MTNYFKNKKLNWTVILLLLNLILLIVCLILISKKKNSSGPKGSIGPKGPIGPIGPAGHDGHDGDYNSAFNTKDIESNIQYNNCDDACKPGQCLSAYDNATQSSTNCGSQPSINHTVTCGCFHPT